MILGARQIMFDLVAHPWVAWLLLAPVCHWVLLYVEGRFGVAARVVLPGQVLTVRGCTILD